MRLVGFPTLLAGVVLLAAGAPWFQNAQTVGLVLVVVSAAAIAFNAVVVAVAASVVRRRAERVRRARRPFR